MKKTIILLAIASSTIMSCHKDPAEVPPLTLLQHQWTVDSVLFYTNINFTGNGEKAQNISGTADFRTDNKEYDISTVLLNGNTETTYDTSVYHLKNDNKTLINNIITDGQITTSTDSSIINTLTDKNLVISNLNDNGVGYYIRTYLHR